MKVIKKVTTKGIFYIDDNKKEQFVSFKECHINWLNYRKREEQLYQKDVKTKLLSHKYVGQRDICAAPPFIELFTRPFTKFEFSESSTEASLKAFNELNNKINSAGWNTIDLS